MKTLKDYEYYRTEKGVLYCGDSFEILALLPMGNIIITDYPYNEVNRKDNGLRNLDKKDADIITFDLESFTNILCSKTKGSAYIFCGYKQISDILQLMQDNSLSTRLVIWEKTNPSPMNGKNIFLSGIESCVYGKKANATFNGMCLNSVFKIATEHNQIHPTQKPLDLFIELIKISSNEGDLVIDPFFGSGTTGLACEKLNRRWIGIEISEKYCAIAKKRIEEEARQIKLFT